MAGKGESGKAEKQSRTGKVGTVMAKINNKTIKCLSKLIEAGFETEKAVLAMTMDDILSLPGISVAEIGMINEIQKAVKANKVLTFLAGGEYE